MRSVFFGFRAYGFASQNIAVSRLSWYCTKRDGRGSFLCCVWYFVLPGWPDRNKGCIIHGSIASVAVRGDASCHLSLVNKCCRSYSLGIWMAAISRMLPWLLSLTIIRNGRSRVIDPGEVVV